VPKRFGCIMARPMIRPKSTRAGLFAIVAGTGFALFPVRRMLGTILLSCCPSRRRRMPRQAVLSRSASRRRRMPRQAVLSRSTRRVWYYHTAASASGLARLAKGLAALSIPRRGRSAPSIPGQGAAFGNRQPCADWMSGPSGGRGCLAPYDPASGRSAPTPSTGWPCPRTRARGLPPSPPRPKGLALRSPPGDAPGTPPHFAQGDAGAASGVVAATSPPAGRYRPLSGHPGAKADDR
jgi:hypothetical protein